MNPELEQLLSCAQTLYEDVDCKAVAEWKSSAPGRKAIGYLPIYVPRELIHAAGMLPVGIFGGGDRLEIIRGDAYFQSYICHIPRSTIELALSGRLDVLDGMLFPSICDVIRNLSGMWTMLFPGRYVRYVDLPQNFDTRVGGEFWRRECCRSASSAGVTGWKSFVVTPTSRATSATFLAPRSNWHCRDGLTCWTACCFLRSVMSSAT